MAKDRVKKPKTRGTKTGAKKPGKKKRGKKKTGKEKTGKTPRPPSTAAAEAPDVAQHLLLQVRFEPDDAEIIATERASRPPRSGSLRRAEITPGDFTSFPPGAGEVILAFHDGAGRLLEAWAGWGRARAYFDEVRVDRRGEPHFRGGALPAKQDDRLFHVTVPSAAVYLTFFRTWIESLGPTAPRVVVGDGEWGRVELRQKGLAAYRLYDTVPPPPPGGLVLEWGVPGSFEGRGYAPQSYKSMARYGWHWRCPRWGWLAGVDPYIWTGRPDQRFNIIVSGDGFGVADQVTFDQHAKTVVDGLFGLYGRPGIEPYRSLIGAVNVFIVRVVSWSSGIRNCAGGGYTCADGPIDKNTYYHATGCWSDPAIPISSPGYVGTRCPPTIFLGGQSAVATEITGMFLLLVNCPQYGGSAFPDLRLAFVTLPGDDDLLINVAAHECAHVIGDLAEEYISPLNWDGTHYRNIVYRSRMHAPWWKTLAQPGEWNPMTSKFNEIHDCPTPPGDCDMTYTGYYGPDSSKLGLYWGAQFVGPGAPPDLWQYWTANDPYESHHGNNFFRGMAWCKMRRLDKDFCRVCSALIRHEILQATYL